LLHPNIVRMAYVVDRANATDVELGTKYDFEDIQVTVELGYGSAPNITSEPPIPSL